jgi:hypothetical protein
MSLSDSAVGIATGYRLHDWGVGSSSPGKKIIFLLSTLSRPVLGPIQRPIQWLLGAGIKWSGREADHPHPTSAEVKNTCIYTITPLTNVIKRVPSLKIVSHFRESLNKLTAPSYILFSENSVVTLRIEKYLVFTEIEGSWRFRKKPLLVLQRSHLHSVRNWSFIFS